MNFIFFHTITQNEKLLIAWMKYYYPQFNLSFSGLGWVTFKAPENYHLPTFLKELDCPLALKWGTGLDIMKLKEPNHETLVSKVEHLIKIHSFTDIHFFERAEIKPEKQLLLKSLEKLRLPLNQILKNGSLSLQIFKINDGLYAMGLNYATSFQSPYAGAVSIDTIPEESPSRAYLKLAQLDMIYHFKWAKDDIVLELGAAPGGITYYLLNQNLKVHALDSAPLKISHPNLHSLVESVQRLQATEISINTNWIVVDLNLSPKQMILEVIRLSRNLTSLKGIILTIKLPQIEMSTKLNYYMDLLKKEFPNFKFTLKQVPSHRQETHLVALKMGR